MAVGKGSMERASRAANKTGEVKSVVINQPEEDILEVSKKKVAKKGSKKMSIQESNPKEATSENDNQETDVITEENESQSYQKNDNNQFVMIGEDMPVHYL